MEDFGSIWTYQEGLEEVWQKLIYTTKQLETMQMVANEQMRKHRDDMKQLIDLLNASNKERDDLKNILNKLMSCNNNFNFNVNYNNSPESPVFVLPINKATNSSITESNNSLSDSNIVVVTSPDSSNTTRVNFSPIISTRMDDPIDTIAKGKMLPEKGKLLAAVTDAGPLLQTLLVAGPLPQWRNPPPIQKFKIPPVSIKGCESSGARKASNYVASSSSSHPQMCSSSVLSFSKRQRLH